MAFLYFSGNADAAGRCAYVDLGMMTFTEPKQHCFNLDFSCPEAEKQGGCFKGALVFKDGWVDGGPRGRLRELAEPFGYVDPDGTHWDVPAGYQTDGATIPLIFRPIVGGPWTEGYVKAALVHDFYIRRSSVAAAAVHKVFYLALRAAGNSQRRSEYLYFAVANFGPQWKHADVAAYEDAWRRRKAMLEEVTRWHKEMWDGFLASERKREAQAAIDREVLSRPLPQRTHVLQLPAGNALDALDAFVEHATNDHIVHADRDATLIQSLREQVEAELKRPADQRDNVFVLQFTNLGATTVKFAARSSEELKVQLDLVDELTRAQEQADMQPQ